MSLPPCVETLGDTDFYPRLNQTGAAREYGVCNNSATPCDEITDAGYWLFSSHVFMV